jgi:hypothetical protein
MSAEITDALLASLPPGVRGHLADDVVAHFGAIASTMQHGLDVVDALAVNATPLTAGSDRLRDWERYLGIASSRTALWGTVEARRAAVISRLREYGTPTAEMIRAVLAPLLGYSDSSTLTLLEPSRTAVRTTNEYFGSLGNASMSLVSPGIWIFWVADGGRCAGCPVLDVTITTTGDNTATAIGLQAPGGQLYMVYDKLRGTASTQTYRVYFPEAAAEASIMGRWRAFVYLSGANTGTVDAARLFIEGVDRAGGKASGIYEWAAVFEPTKATGTPDFPAALAAAGRLGLATRRGGIVHIADAGVGLAAGDYGMIPSDNAVPSEFVPGG